ncbi:MAG: DnaD domain protein [Chloroflexi bacterium]|nr:MAG: DnaD domain protein [Chloroflexota bacterium]
MKGFAGFTAATDGTTALPAAFFSELLPIIDNLAELKLTLHCFWLLTRKSEEVRVIWRTELLADGQLLASLAAAPEAASSLLAEALERACARGTLLHSSLPARPERDLYLLNTQKGRTAAAEIEQGSWLPEEPAAGAAPWQVERRNVFTLYEQNIGPITPLVADELRDIEKSFNAEWVEQALLESVLQNKRSLKYVRAILERRHKAGREPHGENGERYKDWLR